MKRIMYSVIFLMLASFAAFAQEAKTTVTINSTFSSYYWGSIVGGIFYDGPVNFTDVTLLRENADGSSYYAFAGMINAMDTVRYDYEGSNEYYLGLGHISSRKTDSGYTWLTLNRMVMYDSISQIEKLDDDLIMFKIRGDFFPEWYISPYIEYYHWIKTGSDAPPVGWFGRAGITRNQPLGISIKGEPLKLGLDLSFGYAGNDGLFGSKDPGVAYYRGVVGLPIPLTKRWTLTPFLVAQLPGDQRKGSAFVDGDHPLFYNLKLTYKW